MQSIVNSKKTSDEMDTFEDSKIEVIDKNTATLHPEPKPDYWISNDSTSEDESDDSSNENFIIDVQDLQTDSSQKYSNENEDSEEDDQMIIDSNTFNI